MLAVLWPWVLRKARMGGCGIRAGRGGSWIKPEDAPAPPPGPRGSIPPSLRALCAPPNPPPPAVASSAQRRRSHTAPGQGMQSDSRLLVPKW